MISVIKFSLFNRIHLVYDFSIIGLVMNFELISFEKVTEGLGESKTISSACIHRYIFQHVLELKKNN